MSLRWAAHDCSRSWGENHAQIRSITIIDRVRIRLRFLPHKVQMDAEANGGSGFIELEDNLSRSEAPTSRKGCQYHSPMLLGL